MSSRPRQFSLRRRRRALAAVVVCATALAVGVGQSAGAPTSLTLNGGIFAPFGGGPFGTIDSACAPGGSSASYFQSTAFLTTTLPDGFGTGSVSTSGTLTYGPTSGGIPASVPTAQVLSASPGPMVLESAAGRADVIFTSATPFSTLQPCATYEHADLSAGPYGDGAFASGCTDRTDVSGRERGAAFFGSYEAMIVARNGDGPVIERGTYRLTAYHRSLSCPSGSSAAAAFSVNFTVAEREPLDEAPPSVVGVPDRAPNGNGWYDGDVVIDWQATDPAPSSGAPSDPPDTDANLEGTLTYASEQSCDPAGNCAAGSLSLSIDKTDPTVTCGAVSYEVNEPGAIVTATVSDAGSGPVDASISAPVATSSAGSFSVSLTGYDRAGRSTTVSCAYSVRYVFEGFGQPIDNEPVVNKANAGQTIPVKWRITDHNGVGISDPSSFVSLTSALTNACGDAMPEDLIETYSGSSGLQYHGDGNWQFNWKTPKSYAGQCRVMRLNLSDGVDGRTATFSFK